MRTQNSINFPSVDFGPALRRFPDGSLRPEVRTQARSLDTSRLEAKYPWVDTVDVRMFLEGFDAGERWSLDSRDSGERKDAASA
jgi:hypothetical protein